jgi:hypothetical protein
MSFIAFLRINESIQYYISGLPVINKIEKKISANPNFFFSPEKNSLKKKVEWRPLVKFLCRKKNSI